MKMKSLISVLVWFGLFLLMTTEKGYAEIQIPKQSDWTDQGIVFSRGAAGSWDSRFEGIAPCAVVKKAGTFFLYYVGADGNRSADGGPRHRALGVATSADGISFKKYSGNPIRKWLPHKGSSLDEEEGVWTCGATLDVNGDVVLYYGALTAESTDLVWSDGRLAVSTNGLDFTDVGNVLDHKNSSVWGFGDELMPIVTFQVNGNWYVYYIAKGGSAFWDLGLAWGPSKTNLFNTQPLLTSGNLIIGGGTSASLSSDTIAVPIFRTSDWKTMSIEVRTVSTNSPDQISAPVETYNFDHGLTGTWLLDKDTDNWFMYYRPLSEENGEEVIKVKTAPVIESGPKPADHSPPKTPTGLKLQ